MNDIMQLYISCPEYPDGIYIGPLRDYYYDTYDGVLTIQCPQSIFSELMTNEKNTLYIINNENSVMHIFNGYTLHRKKGGPHYDEYVMMFQSYEEEKV